LASRKKDADSLNVEDTLYSAGHYPLNPAACVADGFAALVEKRRRGAASRLAGPPAGLMERRGYSRRRHFYVITHHSCAITPADLHNFAPDLRRFAPDLRRFAPDLRTNETALRTVGAMFFTTGAIQPPATDGGEKSGIRAGFFPRSLRHRPTACFPQTPRLDRRLDTAPSVARRKLQRHNPLGRADCSAVSLVWLRGTATYSARGRRDEGGGRRLSYDDYRALEHNVIAMREYAARR
jgi:hypothetical protein